MKVVSLNVNGMNDRGKRREIVEMFERGRIDVLGVSETHLKGCGMRDGREEDEGGAMGGTRGRSSLDRDRKKREGEVCYNGLPKSVGRYRWTRIDGSD